jgi:hypothetical protein
LQFKLVSEELMKWDNERTFVKFGPYAAKMVESKQKSVNPDLLEWQKQKYSALANFGVRGGGKKAPDIRGPDAE